MKFTVALPLHVITPGEFQEAQAIREVVAVMEAAGIDAGYLTDHPIPAANWLHTNGHDALDGFAALGFVAAVSSRLQLHTNVLIAAYRNPFLIAKSAATLQVLSGGRLILGLGAGYQKEEFSALGVDFHRRGRLFDQALDVLRLTWAGGVVKFAGEGFDAPGNEARPIPVPPPPVWIGGGSDKAVDRAARCGDGWSPFFSAPNLSAANATNAVADVDQLAAKIDRIKNHRAQQGRSGAFDVAIGPRASLRVGEPGGSDAFLRELDNLARVGVTWASVELPHGSRQQFIDAAQWFGEEVVARAPDRPALAHNSRTDHR